ncbi:zinc finger protein jing [Vespula squamosa]|uniref:Zinc finger protein jing n=1 Tax=Vespula squamosa TaxID=30214 RepID=A0ABD2A199_VESSQ
MKCNIFGIYKIYNLFHIRINEILKHLWESIIIYKREIGIDLNPFPKNHDVNRILQVSTSISPSNNASQTNGVFAQGNAVSGKDFFKLKVSIVEAQAVQETEETLPENYQKILVQNENRYVPEDQRHDQKKYVHQANEQHISSNRAQ